MKDQPDVLIIGAGVIGLCSAYYLAEQGRQVTVVEKGDVCDGASCGNAGLVVPSSSIPLAAPGVLTQGLKWMLDPESPFYIKPRLDLNLISWLWQFRAACNARAVREAIPLLRDMHRASRDLFEELATRDGLEFGYEQQGMLMLFTSRHGYEEGLEEAHLVHEYGLDFEVLDAAEVRELEPSVGSSVIGGVRYLEDAHLIPAEFMRGLTRVVEDMGVEVRTSTEVLGFETSGRRIVTVKTTRGDMQPEQVVLAAGAWAPRLVRNLRISLPIQPAKGYSVTMKQPEGGPSIPLYLGEAKVAVTPMGDALRFAGTLELAGLDLSINQRRVDAIRKTARDYIAGTEELELIEIWRGLRPVTPDGLPIIGRAHPYENLLVAGGHAMLGLSLGPITGRLIAQLVCDEPLDIDLMPLRVVRFS